MTIPECQLALRYLFKLDVELDRPMQMGRGPFGDRNIFGAKKGNFEFSIVDNGLPPLAGELLTGPADFSLRTIRDRTRDDARRDAAPDDPRRAYNLMTVDVRGVLHATTLDVAIYMHYSNTIFFTNKAADDLAAGKTIDFADSVFVVQPRLEIGDEDVDGNLLKPDVWRQIRRLNATPTVGHAALTPTTLHYQVYEIINPRLPPEGWDFQRGQTQ